MSSVSEDPETAVRRNLRSSVSALFAAITVGIAIRTFFFFPAKVPTGSMEPTILRGSWICVDRVSLHFARPNRGDAVVFLGPSGVPGMEAGQLYVKRLVGLGGESVAIGDDGRVRIDDRPVDTSARGFEKLYAFQPGTEAVPGVFHGHAHGEELRRWGYDPGTAKYFPDSRAALRLKAGEVLVFGDNTLESYDSRAWGPLDRRRVIGRVW